MWPHLVMASCWQSPNILKVPTFCVHVHQSPPHKGI
jgi:hypothetical protein